MSFNITTYDASGVAYNTEYPVYIDGTTPTIPIKGSTYYPGLLGNVMCAFAVDGGNSILGGNVIVSGALNVGGNIVVGSNRNTAGLKFTPDKTTITHYTPPPRQHSRAQQGPLPDMPPTYQA